MSEMVRSDILWFGEAPSPEVEVEIRNRQLVLQHVVSPPGDALLGRAAGAVFCFTAGNATDLLRTARQQVRRLLDYGLRVDVVMPDDGVLGVVQGEIGNILALNGVNTRTRPEPAEIPEKIARHPPGPFPRFDLQIEVARGGEPIRAEDHPLFQRAFADCKKIVLTELFGGRSGARVFSVHATWDTSDAGTWPQPFLVKLDRPLKVLAEERNYRKFAEPFIPFGLRPDIKGVVLGSERGLLIGNFVDRSESLWDLVRRNVAGPAISALGEDTLVGWHAQAYSKPPEHGSVAAALAAAGICRPTDILASYADHANAMGLAITAPEVWAQLSALQQRFLVGPIHGDLHGDNVRVRNGQSILIDLASVRVGPLTADLAALETWLAFELPPEEPRQTYHNAAWAAEVSKLYAPASFRHPPEPADATASYAWMRSAVRQIRQMGLALQHCATEYQAAVAVQLLRRCQWEESCQADRFRRAHGFFIAAQLAADLQAAERMAA